MLFVFAAVGGFSVVELEVAGFEVAGLEVAGLEVAGKLLFGFGGRTGGRECRGGVE